MGIASAQTFGFVNWDISIWAIITTIFLQILSNLANDYGDGMKGADNEKRLGPERTVQSGKISPFQMRMAIIVFSVLSFLSGVYLLSISTLNAYQIAAFLLFGITAIIAAIKYTVGNNAYGYHGFGDIFVFMFFGLLAVLGSSFLISGGFHIYALFPAISIGLLSTAVLNLNNMRDIQNDKEVGKLTIAVRLGIKKAKLYHTILINLSFLSLLIFAILQNFNWYVYISFIMYLFFYRDLMQIANVKDLKELDPFLKKTALKTFLFVLILLILLLI